MDFNEIQELIKLINKSNLTEFKLKDKDFEIQIRTKQYTKNSEVQYVQTSNMSSAPVNQFQEQPPSKPTMTQEAGAPSAAPEVTSGKKTIEVKSPIVGTFYRSAGPDKPAFVKVGDVVNAGSVVCIIEAMKLFNEIESEVTGTVVKVLVEDASPVEYDQVLFLLEV